MFTKDSELFHQCFYSHNFGHDGPLAFHGLGINGKISELQAAMGLSVLPYMPTILQARAAVVDLYDSHLDFDKVQKMKLREHTQWNYSYYPILFKEEATLLKVQKELNEAQIFPRRYFYPSLNTVPFVSQQKMDVSENLSSNIICLPLFVGIEKNIIKVNKN